MGRGGGEIGAAIAASGQHHLVAAEAVQGAVGQVPGHDAAALAVFHDQVEGEVFDEELGLVLQRLLVERVQDGVAGAVGGGAGALRGFLAEVLGHAAKGALVDLAFLGAAERHAEMLELDDRRNRLAAHVFDGVLVAQPVRPLDGVVHVPAPVVLAHIAQRRRNAALGGHGVAARREHLRDAGGLQAGRSHAHGGAEARATGADNNDIVLVIDNLIGGRHFLSLPRWP